jgi:hypothetical protein
MPITQVLLHQRGERDNRELSERTARRCQPQRQGAAHGGGLAPDGGQYGPQSRRRHADARDHAAQDDQDAIVGKALQQQTDDIERAPSGDGFSGTETVRQIAGERRASAHQQHVKRVGERP